jgi:hypothetical protein
MKNFIVGTIFGFAAGLFCYGMVVEAQCCGQLDVPLNSQIEQEYQALLQESEQPRYPRGAPDAWRSSFLDTPCAK